MSKLEIRKFKDIDLNDKFFDSLKADYSEFEEWFKRKKEKQAFVMYVNGALDGFLYLKIENQEINDVKPPINSGMVLKVGTFKINPHGTRLGERFIKKALDIATAQNVNACYVTVFAKHKHLIQLLGKYGFEKYGTKTSSNGTEEVLVKNMKASTGNTLKDFPLIDNRVGNKFLLSVYPKYHTALFPDSILDNETYDILKDVSHTNSIHKIYVASMKDMGKIKPKDKIIIYRTKDNKGSAEYRSVATSICTVEEVFHQSQFASFDHFFDYASTYSIFDKDDLLHWYKKGGCYTIKMTYNAALSKRLIRKTLADECGLNRNAYWGILPISDFSFNKIVELGGINESLIIN